MHSSQKIVDTEIGDNDHQKRANHVDVVIMGLAKNKSKNIEQQMTTRDNFLVWYVALPTQHTHEFRYYLLSVWTERRNKKEPRTRSRYRSPC